MGQGESNYQVDFKYALLPVVRGPDKLKTMERNTRVKKFPKKNVQI